MAHHLRRKGANPPPSGLVLHFLVLPRVFATLRLDEGAIRAAQLGETNQQSLAADAVAAGKRGDLGVCPWDARALFGADDGLGQQNVARHENGAATRLQNVSIARSGAGIPSFGSISFSMTLCPKAT